MNSRRVRSSKLKAQSSKEAPSFRFQSRPCEGSAWSLSLVLWSFFWILSFGFEASLNAAPKLTAAETEFFESKIRPVFVENCYKCHSAGAEKLKGGLLLDTR